MIWLDTPPQGSDEAVKPSTQVGAKRRIQWLDTGGGPFVIIPASELRQWGGVRGDGSPNEFDRACEVSDYLGTIDFGVGHALVLGDAPFPTAYLSAPTFGGGFIVRMLWGDDLERASRVVHRIGAACWTSEPIVFDASDTELVLFDASHPGVHARHRIEVSLPKGQYAVSTADWEDDTMCLLVHRLLPFN